MSRTPSRSFSDWVEHVVVLAAFALIAVVLSYPLITQFGDHIAGVEGDVWSYLWAMGWAKTATLNLSVNPFHTDFVYYPLGGATQLLWGTALPSFASIPLQLTFGLVPAFNLAYLGASVLTGYGTWLLAREVLRGLPVASRGASYAAFLAGVVFTFGALRLGYGLAFTNLFHTEFIPFYILCLLRVTGEAIAGRPRWTNAILAGLFFGLNVYVDLQLSAFLAVFTALWFGYVLIKEWRKRKEHSNFAIELKSLGTRWGAMIAVAGVLALPMLGLVVQDFAVEGGDYIRVYPLDYSAERSYDLLSFVLPNARSSLYEALPPVHVEKVNASVTTPDDSEMSPDRQAFLGITVLILALIGALRFRREMLFWILATLVLIVLSLGPVLHIAGNATGVPLPFALTYYIPILNHVRIPMRYGIMVALGVAMLAGAGTQVLLAKRVWLIAPLLGLVLLEASVLPYPTLAFRVPPFYEQLSQDTGDYTVLDIPSFNWRWASKNEAFQAVHQKRILRGYTNRIAPDVADYFNLRQTPIMVRSLRILEGAEKGVLTPQEIAEDKAQTENTLRFFDVRYAVLHRDEINAQKATAIDEYLRTVLGAQVVSTEGGITAYQLPEVGTAPSALTLKLADNASLMYLGRGWQTEPFANQEGTRGRYLTGEQSEMFFDAAATPPTNIRLHVWAQDGEQVLQASWNDQATMTIPLHAGWADYTLALAADDPPAGTKNRLELGHGASPKAIAVSAVEIR